MPSLTWTCPNCQRRVPNRVDACHCGTTRGQAELLAASSPSGAGPGAAFGYGGPAVREELGWDVKGPFTAYAQANVIEQHGLEASGGKTYAELERDDPTRQTVMDASFLRSSLFTSVVAFGVAFMAAGLGVVLIAIGIALLLVDRRLSAAFAEVDAASAAHVT